MKRSYSFLIISFFVLAFLASGCSKDDSNPSATKEQSFSNTPPAVPDVNLNGPASNSSDPALQLIKGYFSGLSLLRNYTDMFRNVEATYLDSTWIRKYVSGSITAILTTTRLADGSYAWKLTINGTKDSVNYDNWLALQGTSSADGKTGTWSLFKENTNLLTGDYSWQKNDDGSLTATLREYYNGSVRTRIEASENTDKSGQVLLYFGSTLSYKAMWKPDGSGEWWQYDSSGNIRHQGTWS
ncbi:MAG: hypothetical protein HF314_04340 [Ignavibacteria bacterium]|jgi:hypothetical protein|nr:hypothetical protein [Ignavibacteria bacterium]MCU7502279.1 hypothetical protein [Ignavibacteria bacterium]MCU7516677.1 hypothetical protein [Ignavibacteria bacterium]